MTTNFVKQKFQWFFDFSTSTTSVQNIRIMTGGDEAIRRMLPFFTAFKRFKMGKVKVRFVPAATLPVDPTGLSYEAGENTVDPRDQFNPGLVRITNGDDLVNVSADNMQSYYATMLDKRWFKFQLQTGMRRTAIPLVWNVGEIEHSTYPGANIKLPNVTTTEIGEDVYPVAVGPLMNERYFENGSTAGNNNVVNAPWLQDTIYEHGLIQTGRQKIGWLPTDAYNSVEFEDNGITSAGIAPLPEIELMRIILPKAYKTKFYYRVFVEEEYMFKEPVAFNVAPDVLNDNNTYFQPIDHFVAISKMAGVTGGGVVPTIPNGDGGSI